MSSPGGNFVRIIISGANRTGAAFGAVRRNLRQMVNDARRAARGMRNQFIANGGIAGAIGRGISAAGRVFRSLPRFASAAARSTANVFRSLATSIRSSVNSIGTSISSIGRANPMAAMGGQMGGFTDMLGVLPKIGLAGGKIVGLINMIMQLIPLIQLVAPAAASAGLAMLGFKLAINGVTDALSAGLSGNAEEFEKALKKLEPAAANTVRELVRLRDVWKPLQQRVQGEVFAGAADELKSLSNFIKPIADEWLPRLALRFAEVRSQLANGLANFAADGRLADVWRNVHTAVSNVLDVVAPLARAFGDVLSIAAPRFADLTGTIKAAAQAFSDWIRGNRDSGQLGSWLDKAMETFGKLKDIAVNVGKVIGAIFSGTSEGSGGFLDMMVEFTAILAKFFKDPAIQNALKGMMMLLKPLAYLIGGVVLALMGLMLMAARVGTWIGEHLPGVWNGFVEAGKWAIMRILDFFGMLINGAAKAFSWIPGIGDKLKQAAAWFNNFRDSVNESLNGINKTVDINVNYRARMIGNHLVSGSQQSGTYSSGIGGRAHGGNATNVIMAGERGPELIDVGAAGARVTNHKQTQAMLSGGGGGQAPVVVIKPGGSDTKLMNVLMSALRAEIADSYSGDVQAALGRG